MMEVFMLGSLPPGNYVTLALLTASWLMAFLCVFVVGEVTARGKDNLFIYRKAPGGETRLVLARVMQGLLVVQPVAAVSALVVLLPAGLSLMQILPLTAWMVAVSSFYVVMSTGLFLLFPAFSEKPMEVLGNAVLMMAISFLLFIFSFAFFGEDGGLYALMISSAVLGTSFLFLGWRKLTRLE
jgi:hypothetical protein